jgi:glucose dehydrogenase
MHQTPPSNKIDLFTATSFASVRKLPLLLTGLLLVVLGACSPPSDTTSISVATGASGGRPDSVPAAASGARANASMQTLEWPLHNMDLFGSRSSPSDQITPDNVAELTPTWLFQHGVIDGVSNQTTPVVVDGIMYRFPRQCLCRQCP